MAASDALDAAAIVAVDPAGTGVLLRAGPGPARDRWLARLRALWPEDAPLRRVPATVPDDRLLGGLDLAATLAAGHPVSERGILAAADGGALILAMAERLPPGTAAHIAAAMDAGAMVVQRDGIDGSLPARFGVIALDEGMEKDECTPRMIAERLAIHLVLDVDTLPPLRDPPVSIAPARARLGSVTVDASVVHALCAAAHALGVDSLRAPLQALAVARAAAALAGRDAVGKSDVALAARLVLAPRATRLPAAEEPAAAEPDAPDPSSGGDAPLAAGDPRALDEVVLAAAKAAIPAGLLASLRRSEPGRGSGTQGRVGTVCRAPRRGRPAGVRPGSPQRGGRLALVATLRAAAPWQALRRLEAGAEGRRVIVRRDDIRLVRLKAPSQTTTIFAVDASGSAALARLAEAKGAVESLLADCYVRRDTVALIAFRGTTAELVLPPTGSLTRARRCLAALPGGGGTPLAGALDLAATIAAGVARRGRMPVVVLLTDGRANVARDGTPGRSQAEQDALDAARRLRAAGRTGLVIDTAARPQPQAARIAHEMGARYLALPYADATALGRAVRAGIETSR